MTQTPIIAKAPQWMVSLAISACVLPFCANVAAGRPDRVNLFPRLRAGQTLAYQISYQSDKQINTHSSIIVASPSDNAKVDVRGLLRLEILAVERQGDRALIHARSRFEVLNSDSHLRVPEVLAPDPQRQRQDPHGKSIDFVVLPDGRIDSVKGLDQFFPEQQQAWQEWVSRFALAAAFPGNGAKLSQRWKSDEPEKSPAPIAGLRWLRESTYVRNEPCHAMQMTVLGEIAISDAEPETCAVLLTTAALKQDSPPQNATPEDFKLHELRTSGTARGTNRIITYVSLKTGLIVRATEEAQQQMDVTVAKADGSNRVRYAVNAKSHSEIVLVSEMPLTHP
jgi:hypothetical protein